MTWGLVAVAGASVVSGVIGSNAASSAADAQLQGANEAAQVQREGLAQQESQFTQNRDDALSLYNTSRNDLSPYRNIGTNALLALSDQLGIARPSGFETTNTGNPQFKTDPGYDFAFNEGLKAVDARFPGMSQSGAKEKALTTYGQGVADQQYGNWLSRLGTLATAGQTATGQSATLAQGTSNTLSGIGANSATAIGTNAANTGNLLQNAAAARASGYVGSANAINGSISGGVNNALTLYGMNNGFNPALSNTTMYAMGGA